jgi:glyoxylase-like metal-dependent hydrolase (beta-lactamase superfamily II)/8-oxo-dGTP pyrophosphatase MutT (NUDIX family)
MAEPAKKPKFREAATVVLVRGHGADLEVYWVRRSDAVAVMPGLHAFPGGKADAEDATLEVIGAAEGVESVLRACGIREAFEEMGVLVGLDGTPPDAASLTADRERVLSGAVRFGDLARTRGWRFRADRLLFAGRWQTPPFAAVRFDTIFWLVHLEDGQHPSVHVGELASGEWVRPLDALQRWIDGHCAYAAPLLYTLLALAEGGEALAERLASAPERARTPVRRIELLWGLVLHPMRTRPLPPATHTNAYVVGVSDVAIVDPGSDDPAELEQFFALMDHLIADGRTPQVILLTHHHPDHIAGVEAVRARYGIQVAAHAETARHLRVDVELSDGDRIPLGAGRGGDWTLRVVHTPGHAPGHLCFLHERTRTLLTGDHVPGGSGTVIIDPPEGDMKDYVASLERLGRLDLEFLFPAHGSPQGAAYRRIAGLIAHRRERERKVLEALERAPHSPGALVERAYADTPRELWGYAERSLLAHLIALERSGHAARDGEGWRRA